MLLSKQKKSIFNLLFKVIVIFGVFYSVRFSFLPSSFNVRYISIFFLLVLYIFSISKDKNSLNLKINKIDFKWIVSVLFVLFYTFAITTFRDTSKGVGTYLSTTFNYFIMVAIIPFLIKETFESPEEFCKCMAFVTTIQAIIVLSTLIYTPMKEALVKIQDLSFSSDFDKRYYWRVIGIGIFGSGGSIYLFCGLLCTAYLQLFCKNKFMYLFSYIVIFAAISMVARTGFYISIVLTFYLLAVFVKKINKKAVYLRYLAVFLAGVFLLYFFAESFGLLKNVNTNILQYTFGRLDAIFADYNALDRVQETYSQTPGLSIYTLFGSGIYRGMSDNGLYFWNDSGYAKRYAAIGLIMTIFSYLTLLFYLLKKTLKQKREIRVFFILLILILFIIEYKEHYIYMYSFPATLITILLLHEKEQTEVYRNG